MTDKEYVTAHYSVPYLQTLNPEQHHEADTSKYLKTVEDLEESYKGYLLIKEKICELGWEPYLTETQNQRIMEYSFEDFRTAGNSVLQTIKAEENRIRSTDWRSSMNTAPLRFRYSGTHRAINPVLGTFHLQDNFIGSIPWVKNPFYKKASSRGSQGGRLSVGQFIRFLDDINTDAKKQLKANDTPQTPKNITAVINAHSMNGRNLLIRDNSQTGPIPQVFYDYLKADVPPVDALIFSSIIYVNIGTVPLDMVEEVKGVPYDWYAKLANK